MEMGKVYQVLMVAIGLGLYWKMDERVHFMFRGVFVDKKQSVRYMNGASFVLKILEFFESKNPSLVRAMSLSIPLELQLYLTALVLLKLDAKNAGVYNG